MRILATLLLLGAAAPAAALDDTPIPPDHYTKAELTSFKSTPSAEEVSAFLDRLAKTSPYLHVETFGKTAQGRAMQLVVASKEKAFTPEAAAKAGKPRVLVINSIHGGEVDGTDACLILLRDLALRNRDEI